jgi:glycosyltransferase involved in cell wall biosynthesis
MLISVIIPNLNSGGHLAKTLKSLITQSAFDSVIEILIVDGGSTDDSLPLAHGMNISCLRVIECLERGQAVAVNSGFKLAIGDILHWHAADDIFLPNSIARVAGCFSENTKLDLLFSDGLAFDDQSIYLHSTSRYCSQRMLLFWGNKWYRFQSDTAYFKRELLSQVGFVRNDIPLTCDEDFFLRCVYYSNNILWVPVHLGGFRIRHGQVSQTEDKTRLVELRRDSLRRLWVSNDIRNWKIVIGRIFTFPYLAWSQLMIGFLRLVRLVNRRLNYDQERVLLETVNLPFWRIDR